MKHDPERYSRYVEHPRFGRFPHDTGLNPDPRSSNVSLHWNAVSRQEIALRYEALSGERWPYGEVPSSAKESCRIPNSAVAADLVRQTPATVPVTHYFDLERVCRDCLLPFIFHAEEQKHWYEVLGFGLDSNCVRCVLCRKRTQSIARLRKRYEHLLHMTDRTAEETLELADCCLSLVESTAFSLQKLQCVRMLLNQLSSDERSTIRPRTAELVARLSLFKGQGGKPR
jgi:hypothetical protein